MDDPHDKKLFSNLSHFLFIYKWLLACCLLTFTLFFLPYRLLLRENRKVANKLGFYTVLMLTVPIITFYICFYFLFSKKAEPLAWSGFAAVGAANIIVAAYVYSAFSEPDEVEVDARVGSVGKFDNDASRPRVGAFKQRTD